MQVISEMTFSSGFVHFEISFATRQKVIQFYEPQFGFSLTLWTYDRSQKCLKIILVEARCSLWWLSNSYCICVWGCPDVRHIKQ